MKSLALSINAGCSSLKGAIYDIPLVKEECDKPLMEFRWEKSAKYVKIIHAKGKEERTVDFSDHIEAFDYMIECMREFKALENNEEIKFVVNRAVNGGRNLLDEVIPITDEVQEEFNRNINMAPEHNPSAIKCSEMARSMFKTARHYYMFDTAFHRTIPMENKIYALPIECYEDGVQVYGAHGISHADMTERAAKALEIEKDYINLISLHLGGGCSASCIKNGKCIDTTMGYTPTDGLLMAGRCGHIDPGMFPYLLNKYKTIEEVMRVLNKESGFKGLTGEFDMRIVQNRADDGEEIAEAAINKYINDVRKTIGAYFLELDGTVDAVVFTGGSGEKDVRLVREITKDLEWLGINLSKNQKQLTSSNSPVKVLQFKANEEFAMAKTVAKYEEENIIF